MDATWVLRRLISKGLVERISRGKYFPTKSGLEWLESKE